MAKNTDLWKVLEQEGYDPGNPNDPVNELLRNIQEATPKTGPLTYVRNEENLLRFLVAYQNMALLAENHEGEWVDLNAEPEDAHFSIAVAFPALHFTGKDLVRFQRVAMVADAIDLDPASDCTVLLEVWVEGVFAAEAP